MATVEEYLGKGYHVVYESQAGHTHMLRPKRWSWLAFFFSWLFIVGPLIYLLYHLAVKRDQRVTVLPDGRVMGEKWTVGRWYMRQGRPMQIGLAVAFVAVIVIIVV